MARRVRTSPSPIDKAIGYEHGETMHTARAIRTIFLFLSLLPLHAQTVTCNPKTGSSLEKQFCKSLLKEMSSYKLRAIAPNRTFSQSVITFETSSGKESIAMTAVFVQDPISNSMIRLIFSGRPSMKRAVKRTIEALDDVLKIPPTNMGWVIQVPN
jgi:hypothetical protein